MHPRTMATRRAQTNTATTQLMEALPGVDPGHVETMRKLSRRGDGGPNPDLALENAAHVAEMVAALTEALASQQADIADLRKQLAVAKV